MTETGELGSAYVVLACDGTVRVVPCVDDFDVERELGLNLNRCIFFPDAFAAALDTLAIENGPQHAYGVGLLTDSTRTARRRFGISRTGARISCILRRWLSFLRSGDTIVEMTS